MPRTVKPNSKEIKIEAELVVRVRLAGGVCHKLMTPGRRGQVDRLVLLPGPRIVFVELKRPRGGRVSPHQKAWHACYQELGCEVALVKNSEDIDRLLRTKN